MIDAVAEAASYAHCQRRRIPIDPQGATLAVELEKVRKPGAEREVALDLYAAAGRELQSSAVVLAQLRSERGRDGGRFIIEKPAQQIQMMAGKIEENASACRPSSFPLRHCRDGDRLAERALDRADPADATVSQQRPGLFHERVPSPVEADHADDPGLLRCCHDPRRARGIGGDRLLEVKVLAGFGR